MRLTQRIGLKGFPGMRPGWSDWVDMMTILALTHCDEQYPSNSMVNRQLKWEIATSGCLRINRLSKQRIWTGNLPEAGDTK